MFNSITSRINSKI